MIFLNLFAHVKKRSFLNIILGINTKLFITFNTCFRFIFYFPIFQVETNCRYCFYAVFCLSLFLLFIYHYYYIFEVFFFYFSVICSVLLSYQKSVENVFFSGDKCFIFVINYHSYNIFFRMSGLCMYVRADCLRGISVCKIYFYICYFVKIVKTVNKVFIIILSTCCFTVTSYYG